MSDDGNWGDFSVDQAVRSDKSIAWFTGEQDVNPSGELTYWGYLRLEELLNCQRPGTRIPDERIFVVTHQLCELAFKQMLFDFEVLGRTLQNTIEIFRKEGESGFLKLDIDYWRPAITAAGRIEHAVRRVLPGAIGYLSYHSDPTFDSHEFGNFREKLIPASGFQSAQFRAIQAALGKRNLLELQMYPSAFYRKHYHSQEPSPAVSPSDRLIVQTEIGFGLLVDDLFHQALGLFAKATHQHKPPKLTEATFAPALVRLEKGVKALSRSTHLRKAFGDTNPAQAMVQVFRESITGIVAAENKRRVGFEDASSGIDRLRILSPNSPLLSIVRLIASTDHHLHGQHKTSFLSLHREFVNRRIKEVNYYSLEAGKSRQTPGTGGGGMPYLDLMHRSLIPHFPALVGLKGVEKEK